ncbi:MAG TPA: hypothetical protein VGA13_01125 [Acidimicrobiales bacterium]
MRRLAVASVALALVLSGCALSGLAFREDDRVTILEPADRAEVTLPLTIRWSSGGAGPYFAVFVDREPVRPGQSLRAVADDSCNRTPGCPDVAYLRERYVYLTDQTWIDLDVVARRGGSQRTSADNRHEATIVLVDGEGRRIGEAAYTVEFTVRDEEAS